MTAIHRVAPVKCIRAKQRSEDWMTGELLQLIRDRDQAFKSFKRTKLDVFHDKYIKLRNMVQSLKFKPKAEYYSRKVEDYKNQPKKLWRTLNFLGASWGRTNLQI